MLPDGRWLKPHDEGLRYLFGTSRLISQRHLAGGRWARLSDPCPEGGAAREKTRKTNVCLAVFVQVLEPSLVDFVPYQCGKWTFTLTTSHCLSFLRRDGVKINSRVIVAQREQTACWLSYRGDETRWIWRTGCGWYSVKCKYRGAVGGENRMVSQLSNVSKCSNVWEGVVFPKKYNDLLNYVKAHLIFFL